MRIPVVFGDSNESIDATLRSATAPVNAAFNGVETLTEYVPSPKIVNGYWYCYDNSTGEYVNTNVKAAGIDGGDGVGIASAAVNEDYTLTLTFTDGTTYTSGSIRGATGDTGPQGERGSQGIQGEVGPQGPQGVQGEPGATGSQGPAGEGVPSGGTTGQVLIKTSGTDYDTEWADASLGDVVYVGTTEPTDPDIQIWLDTDAPGMSAVSSVNGATGTVVLDAEDIGAMPEWTLLWENASPSSTFAEQNITVPDLSNYSMLRICAATLPDTFYDVLVGGTVGLQGIIVTNSLAYVRRRMVTINSTTQINIGDNYQMDVSSGASLTRNDYNQPLKIYAR